MYAIDNSAKFLYKDIQTLHAQLEKVLKKKSIDRMQDCFLSIFGSSTHLVHSVDAIYNPCRELDWACQIPVNELNSVSYARVAVRVDRNHKYESVRIHDISLYTSRLPLEQVEFVHGAWKKQLEYAIQLLEDKKEKTPAVFNYWSEAMVLANTGWLVPESSKEWAPLSGIQVITMRCAVNALKQEPEKVALLWPTLTPWLHAVQFLLPPPDESDGVSPIEEWQAWSESLRGLYAAKEISTLNIPEDMLIDSTFNFTTSASA